MFLRASNRKKDGKTHTYWSIVENKRLADDRVVQRHVLYLGEINSSQQEAWRKTIEVFSDGQPRPQTVALFPEDRAPEVADESIVRIRLDQLQLRRPRQFGACWLASFLYYELRLDWFWSERLPASRKGTRWDLVLQTLVVYRLLAPGSEWFLHRAWFESSAMADLLEEDFGLVEIHKLYECLDLLTCHKSELLLHLKQRWVDLYNAQFEVLLYDLTSTYFESNPPFGDDQPLRQFGYSRDKRPDCVQVVLALVVTPEGFPVAYELLNGNTSDKTTLPDFLARIEKLYGKAQRIWVMDRGIPTEEVLEFMRQRNIAYLVGTPRARLNALEKSFLELEWEQVRPAVEVKLLEQDAEVYVLACSHDRRQKERAMRRRKLKGLLKRLKALSAMKLSRDELLIKIGAAEQDAGRAARRLVEIDLPSGENPFGYRINREALRIARRREGQYLLRTNQLTADPKAIWEQYLQLVRVEEAFRDLKGDLAIRPIYHKLDSRIEAHIFVAFLAYCLHAHLHRRLRDLAPGLTPRSVFEKLATIAMVDVHLPTTDGREVVLTRFTQPENDVAMILQRLRLALPDQPPPRITAAQVNDPSVVQT